MQAALNGEEVEERTRIEQRSNPAFRYVAECQAAVSVFRMTTQLCVCRFLFEPQSEAYRYFKEKCQELTHSGFGRSNAAAKPISHAHAHANASSSRAAQLTAESRAPITRAEFERRWPGSGMSEEEYARRMTGGSALDDKQRRELATQYELQMMTELINARKRALQEQAQLEHAALQSSATSSSSKKSAKKRKFEYDSDEEVDKDDGTWEHKARKAEMRATGGEFCSFSFCLSRQIQLLKVCFSSFVKANFKVFELHLVKGKSTPIQL